MREDHFLAPADVDGFSGAIIDVRFDLMQPAAGRAAYGEGHIPGAHFLDLEDDLSAPRGEHGGRHPLPSPAVFAQRLAELGVVPGTELLLYDDSRCVFAARLWWMLRGLGFGPLRLLDGGYAAWMAAGGTPSTALPPVTPAAAAAVPENWPGCIDHDQVMSRQAAGALLVDAREAARYRGEHEPIDPVAGHIPGADNRPWQALTTDDGYVREAEELRAIWGDLLEREELMLYCGSGVSACLNLLTLSVLGRDDAILYGGSWSDWCSYL